MLKDRISELFWSHASLSKTEIMVALAGEASDASVKRTLQQLIKEEKLLINGAGRATRYRLSPRGRLLSTIDTDTYYLRDIDERSIIRTFNF